MTARFNVTCLLPACSKSTDLSAALNIGIHKGFSNFNQVDISIICGNASRNCLQNLLLFPKNEPFNQPYCIDSSRLLNALRPKSLTRCVRHHGNAFRPPSCHIRRHPHAHSRFRALQRAMGPRFEGEGDPGFPLAQSIFACIPRAHSSCLNAFSLQIPAAAKQICDGLLSCRRQQRHIEGTPALASSSEGALALHNAAVLAPTLLDRFVRMATESGSSILVRDTTSGGETNILTSLKKVSFVRDRANNHNGLCRC